MWVLVLRPTPLDFLVEMIGQFGRHERYGSVPVAHGFAYPGPCSTKVSHPWSYAALPSAAAATPYPPTPS